MSAFTCIFGNGIDYNRGILATNKLVNFRLDKIEAKVEKHNNLVERVYCAEKDIRVLQQKTEDF